MMEARRALGVAAQFVSGYVSSRKGRASRSDWGAGQLIVMADYLPGAGWIEFDPTNGLVGGEDLIRVAVARDPVQAAPLTGAFLGNSGDELGMEVTVEVTQPNQAGARHSRPRLSQWAQGRQRMIIRAGYAIAFECAAVTPMILHLNIHPSRADDLISPDVVRTEPYYPTDAYLDLFGNRVTRVEAQPGVVTFHNDFTIRDDGSPDEAPEDAPLTGGRQTAKRGARLPARERVFDSDNLSDFAWSQFGGVGGGAKLVQAICDYVHGRIHFDYGARTRAARPPTGRPRDRRLPRLRPSRGGAVPA